MLSRCALSRFLVHSSEATFLDAVLAIVFAGPEPKMIRANAARIIAGVQNKKMFRLLSKMHLPRNVMRVLVLTIPPDAAIRQSPTSWLVGRSDPIPARFGLMDLFPESYLEWNPGPITPSHYLSSLVATYASGLFSG